MFPALILLISSLLAVGKAVPAGGVVEACSDVRQHTSAINMISRLVNQGTNDQFYKRVGRVDCIKTQVVAGTLYYVEADLVQTTCRRGDNSVNELELTEAACPQKEGTETEHCNLEFWEQPWIQNMDEAYQLTKKECVPSTPSGDDAPPMGGDQRVANLRSKEVTAAAEQSAILLRQRVNSYAVKRIAKLVSAKKQVVAGLKWTFVYYFGNTKCRQNQVNMRKPIDAAKCPFDKGSTIEKCTVELIDQPWMTPPYTLMDNHSCRPASWSQVATAANDNLAIVKEAQTILLRETNSAKVAFYGPKEKLVGEEEFRDFETKYAKVYQSAAERAEKLRIFQINMYIAARYQRFELGTAKYGMTPFSDISVDEFKLTYRNAPFHRNVRPAQEAVISSGSVPKQVDWRTRGGVTPVKNQGSCGSCWAFSTTGNIEGQWFVKKGKLPDLSEQELVDCDKVDEGCNGGLPSQAYKEIIRLGGMVSESRYPYTGRDNTCTLNKSQETVYINSSLSISTNEDEMARWLAANGPISIGINAAAMQFYFGGISHPFSFLCSPSNLDHGVLIVGYAVSDSGEPYWIVKNSWGASWGEKGYYWVYRGEGVCGLNKMPTSAVVL